MENETRINSVIVQMDQREINFLKQEEALGQECSISAGLSFQVGIAEAFPCRKTAHLGSHLRWHLPRKLWSTSKMKGALTGLCVCLNSASSPSNPHQESPHLNEGKSRGTDGSVS